MAFSLAGFAGAAGAASAQQPVLLRPSPINYDVRVTPWPRSAAQQPGPFMPPDAGFVAPPPPMVPSPPIDLSKPTTSSPRTVYYKKDSNSAVKPSAAAELTRPVAAQQPMPMDQPPMKTEAEAVGTTAKEPLSPKNETLFRLDSEQDFAKHINEERLVENQRRAKLPENTKEDRKALDMLDFPGHKLVVGGEGPFPGRFFGPHESVIEPNFVLYRRLYYEDVNTERYGWTIGPLQPLASMYQFFGQVQWAPYKFFMFPCMRHDTGAGQCLPGDPVPNIIYPPGLSIPGAAAQAGVTAAMYFIIP
jgi:hypothetical protein